MYNNQTNLNYKYISLKILIGIFILCIVSISLGKEVNYNDLKKINGLYYDNTSDFLYNGKVVGITRGRIINGKKEGEYKVYFKDRLLLSKSNYKNNKLDGERLEFYDNGKLISKKNYKDGKLEGEYFDYYRFGQIQSKRNYKKGKLNGDYLVYYKNGQLYNKKTYIDGKLEGKNLNFSFYKNYKIRTNEINTLESLKKDNRVLIFGDSVTIGYGVEYTNSFVGIIDELFSKKKKYICYWRSR